MIECCQMKPKTKMPRQKWLPYVRQLADILSLRDWRIEIREDGPFDQDCIATIVLFCFRRNWKNRPLE